MMDKPWLTQYGPGVPATIDPDAHPSLVDLLEDACEGLVRHLLASRGPTAGIPSPGFPALRA